MTWLTPSQVAKRINLGAQRVRQMCESGYFQTAHKPGSGKRAWWKISSLEVSAKQFNPARNKEQW